MSAPPPTIDAAAFLDAAVREGMLTPKCVKELKPKARKADTSVGRFCVDAGRLTAIQSEALEGLLLPKSIAEGFEVVGLLGYGGIGVVYRAWQPALDRVVALKTIGADRMAVATAGARFQQEARAIAKLKHPNIVTAYDYGRCIGESAEGRFYLAMEYVEGTDLDNHIRRRSTLDERETWLIVQQVAAALAHANEAGIVHRDIKPANLLLTRPPAGYPLPDGVQLVKVTDFGLVQLGAETPKDTATRLTVSGATMGTPNYMAPEQIDDAHVDHRADIYALGASAYHMLTGRPPYAGQSLMKVITSKLTGDTEPLESLPGEITRPTAELLTAMMSHDAAERPQDYADLLNRIASVLKEDGLDSRVVLPTKAIATQLSNTPSVQNAETVLSDEMRRAKLPSRRRWLMGVGVGGLAAAGAGLFVAWPRGLPTPLWTKSTTQRPIPRKRVKVWSANGYWEEAVQGDGPYSGCTRFDDAMTASFAKLNGWSEIGRPEHFGIAFTLFLGEAQEVELALTWDDGNDPVALRLGAEQLTFGRSVITGPSSSFPKINTSNNGKVSHEYALHRDARHWLAYFDGVLVGATPVRTSTPPSAVQLTALGVPPQPASIGSDEQQPQDFYGAYLSAARIYPLEPVER